MSEAKCPQNQLAQAKKHGSEGFLAERVGSAEPLGEATTGVF